MYTIRRLTTDADLAAYGRGYERSLRERSRGRLSLELPRDYLVDSGVRGVFDGGGALVGGYVVRTVPPFRCLGVVPAVVRHADPLLRAVPEGELCELTCIWRSHAISAARFGVRVWPRIILDCVRVRRRLVLGLGFDNHMNDIYQVWSPATIYVGPSAAAETPASVHVFAFSPARLAANFVTNFVLLMPRRTLRALGRRRS